MPILLTTPLSTGDIDGSYNEVKIVEMRWYGERQTIRVTVEYGNTVDGVWVSGKPFQGPIKQNPQYHTVTGADYLTMVTTAASSAEALVYADVKDILYAYLMNQGLYPGTIT